MSTSSQSQSASAVLTAIICAGVVTAQFVGGKAARDALFLAQIDITSLPAMVIATSIFSIALVAVNAKGVSRLSPARFVPWAFAVSAVLLLAEWLLTFSSPKLAAVLVYLHISGLGPILGSGFWLVTTERFDPRTAKRKFGQIAAGGTFGGLLGGLLAERVAVMLGVGAMLPVLAILNLVCAWQVRRLVPAPTSQPQSKEFSAELTPEPAWSGVRVLAETPYLRHLALLVLLGSASAALIDYAFKAQAVAALGTGESLLRFFGAYYAIVSLVTFAVQTSMSRFALERFGLAFTTATPSIALFAGSIGALAVPGLAGAIVARGSESVFRGSLFRVGLRGVLHADSDRREARREIDYRRRLRSHRRRGWRRRGPLHSPARAARAIFRDHVLDAALLGRGGGCRQPAEPRVCPDARTKPSRTRGRAGSLRHTGSDHADDDAQDRAGSAGRVPDVGRLNRRVASERSSTSSAGERCRFRDSGNHVASIARSRSCPRGASPGRRTDACTDSSRHPAAGLGSGRRRRDPCVAKSGSEARRAPWPMPFSTHTRTLPSDAGFRA